MAILPALKMGKGAAIMPMRRGVETIRSMLSAFAAGNSDGVLSRVTEDVSWSPGAFVTGTSHYEGRDGVRAALIEVAEIRGNGTRVRVDARQVFVDRVDENKVLVLARLKLDRLGETLESEPAYLFTLSGGKVSALTTWTNHSEGLRQLEEAVEVAAEHDGGRTRPGGEH